MRLGFHSESADDLVEVDEPATCREEDSEPELREIASNHQVNRSRSRVASSRLLWASRRAKFGSVHGMLSSSGATKLAQSCRDFMRIALTGKRREYESATTALDLA